MRIFRWMWDHTEECTLAIVGVPLLGLILMELACWYELAVITAKLTALGV